VGQNFLLPEVVNMLRIIIVIIIIIIIVLFWSNLFSTDPVCIKLSNYVL